jgi:hypothetical protein
LNREFLTFYQLSDGRDIIVQHVHCSSGFRAYNRQLFAPISFVLSYIDGDDPGTPAAIGEVESTVGEIRKAFF